MPDAVIIVALRLLVPLLISLTGVAFGQQAPVARAEFAELFTGVAAGYLKAGGVPLPKDFRKDSSPVTRDEVCRAMLIVAIGSGRELKLDGDPVALLRNSKIVAGDASLFTQPGKNFRPADLVAALIAFSEGMMNRHRAQSADQPAIIKPGGG